MKNEFISDLLIHNQHQLGIELPNNMIFDVNIIRKTSEHRSVCLTILDQSNKKIGVLKFPLNKSEITNQAILHEYRTILDLQKKFAFFNNVPDPKGKLFFDQRIFILYDYFEHKMLFELIEAMGLEFNPILFTIPINWLFNFNKQSSIIKKLDKSFINEFEKKIFARVNIYPDENIKVATHKLWGIFKPHFYALCKINLPFVNTHSDFNPWNLGVGKNQQLVVFDWEDYLESFPVLIDFFYFIIVFFWVLFFSYQEDVPFDNIIKAYQTFYELINHYLNLYQKEYQMLNNEVIDTLFIFFLFHNTLMDLEEKRKSTPDLVFRWLEIINGYKPGNFFLNYFSPDKWIPILKEQRNK
ncbi:MAG: hypothetical protein WC860_04830 [Candidatus Margulisiibacteriota bacterium]|jgi:hypothetical protein